MKPKVNNYKHNENSELKERSISNLLEEKEDEDIIRMREALIKKDELMKKKKENDSVVSTTTKINQKSNMNEIKISKFIRTLHTKIDTKNNLSNKDREFIHTNVNVKLIDSDIGNKDMNLKRDIKEIDVNNFATNNLKENTGNDELNGKNLKTNLIAGSHFDNLKPENGVKISEGNRTKAGEKDYFNYSGRMCKREYENMKQTFANTNNIFNDDKLHKVYENVWNLNIIESLSKNKIDPLLSSPKINYQKESEKISPRRLSSKKSTLGQEIQKINKNYQDLDIQSQFEAKVFNENIFKNRKLSDLRIGSRHQQMYNYVCDYSHNYNNLQYIPSFLNDQTSNEKDRENLKLPSILKRPSKPNIRQIEKELGQSIANKKLPRSRIKTIKYKVH